MKKNIYILSFLLVFSSCDVDRIPEDAISDASFWRSESDLKSATNYLYTFLPQLPNLTDTWSDHGFGALPDPISDGTREVPATATDYNQPYQLIRAANNVIEKSQITIEAGVRPDIVSSYVGEALFFRAWAHAQLVQKYGDVPLILRPLKEDSPELMAPRTPREEVVDAIYHDLDESIKLLPTPGQRGAAGYSRVTSTAAISLKARVALHEGTFAKFHGKGNAVKHLTIARQAAQAVMESGEHELFGSYFNLFQTAGEGPQNKENILVRVNGNSMNDVVTSFNTGVIVNGGINPTRALVDTYLTKDGLPVNPSAAPPDSFALIFTNRDERLVETVMKPGDPYILGLEYTGPSLTWHVTGYCPRKFVDPGTVGAGTSFIDYAVIRYGEVLLIYAEALFELDGQISDADLDKSINLLRQRGKVKALSNAFVTANHLDMRTEIRRERSVELALEGFRYWDLIRWKTAEIELPRQVLGAYFFEKDRGFKPSGANPNLTPDNYILVQAAARRSFDSRKHYLWPLPVNELALNPRLVQNPEWK